MATNQEVITWTWSPTTWQLKLNPIEDTYSEVVTWKYGKNHGFDPTHNLHEIQAIKRQVHGWKEVRSQTYVRTH